MGGGEGLEGKEEEEEEGKGVENTHRKTERER